MLQADLPVFCDPFPISEMAVRDCLVSLELLWPRAAANTEWQSIGGIATLIAERYDRVQLAGRWHRVHQEDCCQALGIHPGAKYENQGGPGFARIMSLIESTDDPRVDRDRLMRTACLIYLLAATDAHAKNFSLLYSRGLDRPSMRLAPIYDIASAWPIRGKFHRRR